jgi:hypothetical protein
LIDHSKIYPTSLISYFPSYNKFSTNFEAITEYLNNKEFEKPEKENVMLGPILHAAWLGLAAGPTGTGRLGRLHTEELPAACYGGAEQREFHRETAAARSTSSGKVQTALSLGVAALCTEDQTMVKATPWWRSAVLARPALRCSTW